MPPLHGGSTGIVWKIGPAALVFKDERKRPREVAVHVVSFRGDEAVRTAAQPKGRTVA
ncbi:hypothetical protein ACFPOD_01085 [Nitratireductor kimnyeongensis]|uniref:Uncharacterized protein n=1 Tax=Nitratireductor kimnyeongensis TaxID=430679 RepID=A0ABW0T550_9HYPH|nr:hypothetical protein [Nitratireductor kimnyeongensis]